MVQEVTILGRGPSRISAPLSGDIWGLNAGYKYCNRINRLFMMHPLDIHDAPEDEGAGDWKEAIRNVGEIISLENYPIKSIISEFGTDYFQSTPAYMIALAIFEGYEKINLLGLDYLDEDLEHIYLRANLEMWIGIAVGRGLEVVIPTMSRLCKPYGNKEPLYGYHLNKGVSDARGRQESKIKKT